MATNQLIKLSELGQSVWLDYIRRSLLTSGRLQRLIDEVGLRGMTSNPTIFEKAIDGSDDYIDELKTLAAQGKSAEEIYDQIVLEDIARAADILNSAYDKTGGTDGFVSIEVLPQLALNAEGSVKEAHRLFSTLARPNVMVKIPGTPQGLPAIERLTAEGVNVNITLLFDIANHEQVMEAYLSGLETRAKGGQAISNISSVASFFVSRVDTAVDKLLTDKIQTAKTEPEKNMLKSLLGKAAVDNAKLAYRKFKEVFSSSRFQALKAKGARVQRPLWASTSTKNPAYSDILYVQELIAKDSVNTMPLETIEAFKDHGVARLTIEEDIAGARSRMKMLAEVGIDLRQVTRKLQDDGVKLFADSFDKLMAGIRARREAALSGSK